MFTAAEFRLVKSKCLSEMETLLKDMQIDVPDWNGINEYALYNELDNKITDKICALMKSSSVIDGYGHLLKLGEIDYDMTETDDDLIDKIINNSSKIIYNCQSYAPPAPIEHVQYEPVERINIRFHNVKEIDSTKLNKVLNNADYEHSKLKNVYYQQHYQQYPIFNDFRDLLFSLISIFDNPNRIERKSREINIQGKLLETTGVSYEYNLEECIDEIKNLAKTLRAGESTGFYINISKDIQQEKKITYEPPPKPLLDTQEVERILSVLSQVNKIKKSISKRG